MPVELWRIYYVDPCVHTIPDPKPKFVIIVTAGDRFRGFLINTDIDKWIRINTGKMACQVQILVNQHSCLRYDSWVDCIDLFAFDEAELQNKMDAVSPAAKAAILAAADRSTNIIPRFKKAIRRSS